MTHRILILAVIFSCFNLSCKENRDKTDTNNLEDSKMDSPKNEAELERRTVKNDSFPDLGPSFSPDGSKIAFYSYINSEWNVSRIYLMNSDGTEVRELTKKDTLGFHTEPIWSPDGRRIAYTSFLEEGARMMTIDRNGDNLKKLVSVSENGFHMFSSWGPAGDGYYFFHWPAGEDFKPDAYHAIGDKITRLTTDGITNRPQVAANGTLYLSKIIDLEKNLYSKHILDRNSGKVTDVPNLEGWFIVENHVIKQKDHDEGTTFILEDLEGNDIKELGTVPYRSVMFGKTDPEVNYVAYNTSFDDGSEIHLLEIASGKLIKLTQNE